jgi:hypothetical protein
MLVKKDEKILKVNVCRPLFSASFYVTGWLRSFDGLMTCNGARSPKKGCITQANEGIRESL